VNKLRNKNKGFTLIELLVVIAIIGLLASVVLLALNSARAKSRDAKRIADIRQIASAMELFFNDNNAYPTNASIALLSSGAAPGLSPKYIGIIPTAPAPADGTCGTAGNAPNDYYFWGGTNAYTMTFCLGGVTGGYSAGSHTMTPSGIQ
jgi:prepilin-type N-terminal cleavage/methylation domain-containing protein